MGVEFTTLYAIGDYKSYFFNLLRFLNQLPWESVEAKNIPNGEKASKILEERSGKNEVRVVSSSFKWIQIQSNETDFCFLLN